MRARVGIPVVSALVVLAVAAFVPACGDDGGVDNDTGEDVAVDADADDGPDGVDGRDADVAPWEPDYRGTCGEPLYSTCSGGADCATSDRAAHWLELWWQAILERLEDPDEAVRATVEVVRAEMREGVYVHFVVDAIVRVGWVRVWEQTEVNLGRAPLAGDPDDATMLGLLREAIPCERLPTGTVSYEAAGALVESCDPGLELDICGFSWRDPPECGIKLWLSRSTEAGLCRYAQFDLERGVIDFCRETECLVE